MGYLLINLTFFEEDLAVGCLDRTFAFAFFSGAVFLPTTVDNANLMHGLVHIFQTGSDRPHKFSNGTTTAARHLPIDRRISAQCSVEEEPNEDVDDDDEDEDGLGHGLSSSGGDDK